MGVRVQIEITPLKGGKKIKTVSLLNSGFESDCPEILIPAKLAQELKFLPDLPDETSTEEYESVGGKIFLHRIQDAVRVRLIGNDYKTNHINCTILISSVEKEVILNDAAISEFKIELIEPKKGKWKFSGTSIVRESSSRKLW